VLHLEGFIEVRTRAYAIVYVVTAPRVTVTVTVFYVHKISGILCP
jgi:hypothetical protein